MKPIRQIPSLIAALLAATRIAGAEPMATPEQKIMAFLWSSSASAEERAELIYYDVKDNYNTRITFTRDKAFTRSDGMHGMWNFEGGKLILTGLDSKDGFTIIFDPATLSETQLSGRIPKGKWRGHKVILKIPK